MITVAWLRPCLPCSFPDTCVIDIEPHTVKSHRALWISFFAEVHYNRCDLTGSC